MNPINWSETPELALLLPSEEAILQLIVGVAVFDLSGLPREYFITAGYDSTSWVQLVFQALGLQTLLSPSLESEKILSINLDFNSQTAILVSTPENYVALLIKEPLNFADLKQMDHFSEWVRQFEHQMLRQIERFTPV